MKNSELPDACKPDKNVLVPPYVYLTEGFDPDECARLNTEAQKRYEAEKARRAAMQPNDALCDGGGDKR